MTTTERVARNVRLLAQYRGMKLRQLSAEMGYKREQLLYARLSGESKLSVDELEQLALILDVPASDLLADSPFAMTGGTGSDLLERRSGCATADETSDRLAA